MNKPTAMPNAPRYSHPPPMSAEYELVLMLDPETPDERRDEIATNARGRIESTGSLKAEKAWGLRKMAYEISRRNEADYRFFRFESESPLLNDLDHNLKITDGVLRFRIFKVDPDSPVIEPPAPAPLSSGAPRGPGRGGPRRGRDDWDDRDADPAPPMPDAAPETPAPAAPEAAAETPAAPPVEPVTAEPEPAPPAEPAPADPAPEAPPADEPAEQ
jgi:ribosomal protein S6